MNVEEALEQRKSTRAFLDKPVEPAKIHRILQAARWAPSGTNTQPWSVAVVSGTKKEEIDRLMLEAFNDRGKGHPGYNYYPVRWIEPYRNRRIACGMQLYSTLRISREDKEKQRAQWMANYRAFDAPVVLFFFLDEIMEIGSFMDYGMFLQSVMLMAVEQGLATCPQAALAEYPDVVRQALGYEEKYRLICGMALGYADNGARINAYRTPREDVQEFTRYFD